ncbi:hypothetical protein SEA_CLUBPENGUIN_27 [Streptomyces phage ClubPenguin]|nr:hypothetical protein SEA_CLUBPENGUIN_27 [Streptomyces phage ClubPenguin]
MDNWVQIVLTSVSTVLASSGFWAYRSSRNNSKSATTRLLMGIAYEHIMTFGVAYIRRGWATRDEYEELRKYFYEPYKALGGNGSAERVMNEVEKLPFGPANSQYEAIFQSNRQSREINDVRVVARQVDADAQ